MKKLACSCNLNYSNINSSILSHTSKRKLSFVLIQDTLFLVLVCHWNRISHWLNVPPQSEICFYKMQFKQRPKLYPPLTPHSVQWTFELPWILALLKKNWTKQNKLLPCYTIQYTLMKNPLYWNQHLFKLLCSFPMIHFISLWKMKS